MDYADYKHLTFEPRPNGVLLVTINRPEVLNAANARLHWEFTQVWLTVDADPKTRVVLVTGAGKAFSAGAAPVLIKEIEEPTFTRHQPGKKLHARILSASDRAVRNCAAWSGIRTAAACFHPLLSQLVKSKHIVREALAPAQSGV